MRVAEFVDRLAEHTGVSRDKANESFRAVMAVIRDGLARGEEVRLEGIGKLVSTLESAKVGRPSREVDNSNPRQVAVSFVQFRSSRTELMKLCPYHEELSDARLADESTDSESAVDRGSTNVGDEPDRNEPTD